jgi:hypothetical protein
MKMRYKRLVGIITILLGVLEAGVYLWIGIGSSSIILFFLGLFIILFGIMFLQRTYFIVNDDSLVFHALLGPARRTYKFLSLKELELENNNIFLAINGKRKMIVSGWWVENNDWQAFLQKINSAS